MGDSADLNKSLSGKNAKEKKGKERAKPPPKEEKFIPKKIERLTIVADSTQIGYSREKYLSAGNISVDSVANDGSDGDSDANPSIDTEDIKIHQILITLGFRPYPNDLKFSNSSVYAVHKKLKPEEEEESKGKVSPKKVSTSNKPSEVSMIDVGNSIYSEKRAKRLSRKSKVYETYRFCDIIVSEFKYRKRIAGTETAAEVILVCPEIAEADRVPMLRNPKRFYMKEPPHVLKNETDMYVVRPSKTFKTKKVEINVLLTSFSTPVQFDKMALDEVADLVERAFDEDEKFREKSRELTTGALSDDNSSSTSSVITNSSDSMSHPDDIKPAMKKGKKEPDTKESKISKKNSPKKGKKKPVTKKA